ncbi:phosphopantetheinyl transferase [Nonomuraea sp. NPDC049714]|uniref:phosphopantetheinyl transferase n=1 Tax=Nonomuraea sp. NPDC049714 TaxID=3364357 RepID=UPI0037A30B3B
MNRWGSAAVAYTGLTRPVELLGGLRVADVFTPAERVRSTAGTLEHWAGRLAGKRAVLRLLGLPPTAGHLGRVEILPHPTPACRGDAACLDGHPPAVHLSGAPATRADPHRHIRVSITHTRDHALAVALASALLPEDAQCAVVLSSSHLSEGAVGVRGRMGHGGGRRG